MPQDRKDSSAADTTKHTLAELLPGPDPTPPPKTPTPTNNKPGGNNNGNNSNNNGNNCRTMMAQNPFEDSQGRPSPGAIHQMQAMSMRPGLPPGGPHPGVPHGMQCGGVHPAMMHGPGGHAKIYPPHQAMVFNPTNPNAPPIYPCGICHKEVHENDQAILCESGCNFWFHRICTGLTEDAFTMLKSEVYAEWVCDRCLATKNIPLVKYKP